MAKTLLIATEHETHREPIPDVASRLTMRDMVESSAGRFDQHAALTGWIGGIQRSVSFRDLAPLAESFAAGMLKLGLRQGEKVAVVGENGPEWAIAWLGIGLAGGVSVPISISWGTREITNLVRQSGARFLVASPALISRIDLTSLERVVVLGPTHQGADDSARVTGELGSRGITFDEVARRSNLVEPAALAVPLQSTDLASIVYTSGTTGAPKGVMLSQGNFLADGQAGVRTIGATTRDRVLLVLPLHHTFPLAVGLTTSLLGGIDVVFESNLRHIQERMAEVHPTIFLGVPALYETMYRTVVARLEADGKLGTFRRAEAISALIKRRTGVNVGPILFRELHQKLGGRLRVLATGGAAAPPDLIRKYLNLGFLLVQGYGLVEATSMVTAPSLNRSRFLFTNYYERLAGSSGHGVQGVDLRLVDVPDKQIYVAKSGEGEILVRGPMVMQGYYQNDAATRATFEDGWLRTGDVGRIDREGNLWITGRAKSAIVLSSGEKVYPDEVEGYFVENALVRDICVLGRTPAGKQAQVCAVVYPDPATLRKRSQETGEPLTPETIRDWVEEDVNRVQAGIASYKRIDQVILADSPLPRTELRKVRRGLIDADAKFDLERLLGSTTATV